MKDGKNLLKIIEEIRKFDSQLEAQAIAIFFYVCLNEKTDGVAMQTLVKELNIAQSSVSRNCYKLSEKNRFNKKGLDLIVCLRDPLERRRVLVKLSPKGKRVYKSLIELVID